MKKIALIIIIQIASMQIFAQDTTVVFIDGKKAAHCIVTDQQIETTLLLKKLKYKKYKSCIVRINGLNITLNASASKRSLEIIGVSTIIVSEVIDKPGYFNISNLNIKKQLLSGKALKLYLVLDPSNPMMMRPSRRIYVGTLIMK